jgi:DNA/RNA endonuclease YhcR with UshA esterase domain
MLLRQERIALLLLCGVTAAVLAASVILTNFDKADLASEYTTLSAEGALVHLQGQIEEIHTTKTGGHITASVNGTSVFIPADVAGKITLHPGEKVSLYGVVQTFRGEREVVVSSPGDIIIRESSSN